MRQGSILGPLLFFIYINDLSDDLSTTAKLFADDSSLFSIIQNVNSSAIHLSSDLRKINNLTFSKTLKTCHPFIYFNNKSVNQVPSQKYLGIITDTKLNFQEHLKNILNKVNKTMGLLRKLQNILPRRPLLTMYKSFIRLHPNYGDINYDQDYNTVDPR